jgi:glutamine synthetase
MNRDDAVARAEALVDEARRAGVRHVNLQFTDITGIAKSVTIPLGLLRDAVQHGKWFDGSAIEGFARTAESDMYLLPDLDTFAILPWEAGEDRTARVFCWVYNPNGDLFPGDPRAVLRRTLEEARALGYQYCVGPELEFFLFNRSNGAISPLPHDRASYFDYSADQAAHVRREMVNALQQLGVAVESAHHEVAAGQHEIDLTYADALRTADNVLTVKYPLKAIAQLHDLYATLDVPAPIAVVGGKVRAMTLEGPVEVSIPPRTQAGRKLRLKGKGFPGPGGRGDLYLEVRVTIPEHPTPEEEALWRKLAEAYHARA